MSDTVDSLQRREYPTWQSDSGDKVPTSGAAVRHAIEIDPPAPKAPSTTDVMYFGMNGGDTFAVQP
jgi:hypothetical protein